MMGCINHFGGLLKDGLLYAECVDTKNGELVNDVRGRYEKESLTHAGVPYW